MVVQCQRLFSMTSWKLFSYLTSLGSLKSSRLKSVFKRLIHIKPGVKYGCLSNFLLKQGQPVILHTEFQWEMPLKSPKSSTVVSPSMWKQFLRITENRVTDCQMVKLAYLNCIKIQKSESFSHQKYSLFNCCHTCNMRAKRRDYKCHEDTITMR